MLVQSVSSVFGNPINSVDALEENLSKLRKYSSTPAPLDFTSKPGKTAAGVFHWAIHNNEVHLFLGKRDDSKDQIIGEWCNLGGKSDALDNDAEEMSQGSTSENLTNTAEREVREESNGIYAHHPRLLRKQPFIALYSPDEKDGFLHYMYWQQVQYLEPEIFNKKVKAAKEEHSKEYTDFMWVKASLLHQAVESQMPLLDVDGKKIEIFGPLFSSLSTEAGKTFLHELATHKKIRRFHKDIRPLCNRLYIENNQAETIPGENIAVHWELPKGKPNPRTAIPFGENAFGKDYSLCKVIGPKGETLSEGVVFSDKKKEEDIFAEAVAAHGMAMIELKRRQAAFQTTEDDSFSKDDLKDALGADYKTADDCREAKIKEYSKEPRTPEMRADLANITAMINKSKAKNDVQSGTVVAPAPNIPQWNPNCEETLSRIHLRIVLGKEYKTPEDFKTSNNPQRAADLANIKAYFSTYNDAECEQKDNEFKREIKLLDSDFDFFADVLEWEEQNKQWPTFFHGASAKQNNMCKSFTYMRELSDLCSFEDLIALRGTDIYFKNDKTVWDMLNRTGDRENPETSRAMLFLNFALLAGLKTTNSTSSTAEYVLNDHSVQEQNIVARFEEAQALAGFSKPNYAYFQSIFEQYIEHKHPTSGNSVLIAIAQNPKNLDDYIYPTRSGNFYKGENRQEIKSTLEVLNGIQNEFERQKKNGAEPFTLNSNKKKALFPEARFFLHPDRAMDPRQTKSKTFDRFPLSEEESAAHDREMRPTTIAIMADWLAQKTTAVEGAFVNESRLKRLYRYAYRGVTHEDLVEKMSVDIFSQLVRDNHFEAVKGYLENYPDILDLMDQENLKNLFIHILRKDHFESIKNYLQNYPKFLQLIDQRKLIHLTLESKKFEFIDYVLNDICKGDWRIIFDNNKISIFHEEALSYLTLQRFYREIESTPLHFVAAANHIELVRHFLGTDGIDPNVRNRYGETPLFLAVNGRSKECISLLLSHPTIDPTIPTNAGWNPLTLAASMMDLDIFTLLINSNKFEFKHKNNIGETVLDVIIRMTWKTSVMMPMLKLLLSHKDMDVNGTTKDGDRILIWAIRSGEPDIIDMLLSNPDIDLSAADKNGGSPLHAAVAVRNVGVMKKLIEKGANINAQDSQGHTPLELARSLGFNKIEDVLRQAQLKKESLELEKK